MWVFIERVDDLYVGFAHDEEGHQVLEVNQPLTYSEIHDRMMEVSGGGDCSHVDGAIDHADNRPNDGRIHERKLFHMIRVRAKAGLATESDAANVVSELRDPNSIHNMNFLLWTLGYLGAQYEYVVVPLLNHPNTNGEAEYAMRALIQMGLLKKYVDRLIEWMRGAAPPNRLGFKSSAYGIATSAFRRSQNPKLLRALIEAWNDYTEKWTTREYARGCVAHAIDLESAPIGERLPPDHPYYVELIQRAELLLAKLETKEIGEH